MLASLTSHDRDVIFQCLAAAARGPFFSDADLSVLFCLERTEFLSIVDRLPEVDDADPRVRLVIGHALVDLPGAGREKSAEWTDWISVSPEAVEGVAARWLALLPPPDSAPPPSLTDARFLLHPLSGRG